MYCFSLKVSLDEIDKPENVETTGFQVPGPLDHINFDHLRGQTMNLMPAVFPPSPVMAPNRSQPMDLTESLPLAGSGTPARPMFVDFDVTHSMPLAGSTPARNQPHMLMPIPPGGSLPRSIPMTMGAIPAGAYIQEGGSPNHEHQFDITQSLPGGGYHTQHSIPRDNPLYLDPVTVNRGLDASDSEADESP